MSYALIDTHAHITCKRLCDRVEEIIENAKENHVEEIMVVCTDFESFEKAKKLQEKQKGIYVALGFHPSDLNEFEEADYLRLKEIIEKKEIDVLGEIGLDYYWDEVEREKQKEKFIEQLHLANAYNLPVIIHMREATKDTLDILKEHAKTKFVMHCFSGSKEVAKEVMKMGGYISFAGPITFKNARGLTEVPQVCDKKKIFVETDCPYLTPHPYRGKENEPMYVQHTYEKVCALLGEDPSKFYTQMKDNFHRFLRNED